MCFDSSCLSHNLIIADSYEDIALGTEVLYKTVLRMTNPAK